LGAGNVRKKEISAIYPTKKTIEINMINNKLVTRHSKVTFATSLSFTFTIVLSKPRNNTVVTIAIKDEKTPHSPNDSGL
jgi:hypothetical protein